MPVFKGKVIAVYGKYFSVYCDGKEYSGTVRGKVLREQLDATPVAVGDNVEFSIGSDGSAAIEEVLPRRQFLARPDIIVKGKKQIIAANLDQLVIITSTRNPRFKPGLVDRFLVSAGIENLKAAVVINKIDLVGPDEFSEYAGVWESLGYGVLFTSAKDYTGLDGFKDLLRNRSSALAGHSGVGKSSLLNALQPELNLRTRMISKSSGRGVHTTSSVIMYPLTFGGWVADTPGLKVFGMAGVNKTNLYTYFPEMRENDGDCRFNNCLHINEPGCAIKAAVESGHIYKFRYRSYKKLFDQLSD